MYPEALTEALAAPEKIGSGSNRNVLLQLRHQVTEALKINSIDGTHGALMDRSKLVDMQTRINSALVYHADHETFTAPFTAPRNRGAQRPNIPINIVAQGSPDNPKKANQGHGLFADVDRWLKGRAEVPEGCISASLAEDSSLGIVIPPYEIMEWRSAVPYIPSFEDAGASVYPLENFGTHQVRVPYYLPDAKSTTYAEETGPTSTQDASVVGLQVNTAKYALLSKISEEVFWDVNAIDGVLTQEGMKRLAMSYTQDFTASLIHSLSVAGMVNMTRGIDLLSDILTTQSLISTAFLNDQNCWMMSRAGLAKLRDTRSTTNQPLFDPATRTFLGLKVVLNDFLSQDVLFGNFNQAVHLAKTGTFVQRLWEQYREQGKIGYRLVQRAGVSFYSDAYTSNDIQPLALLRLDVAGS